METGINIPRDLGVLQLVQCESLEKSSHFLEMLLKLLTMSNPVILHGGFGVL